MRNSHDYVYELMLKLTFMLESAQEIADNPVFGRPWTLYSKIAITIYSDSIMIYSKDKSSSSIKRFREAIHFFTLNLFYTQIPFRGAVAFGTMTLDFKNSIFFGQPLVDAFLLSEELQFYGIVIHGTAEKQSSFINYHSIIEYECPFKNGVAKHFTISPLSFDTKELPKDRYSNLIKITNKSKHVTSGALRKNIDNTIKYLDYSFGLIKNKFQKPNKNF